MTLLTKVKNAVTSSTAETVVEEMFQKIPDVISMNPFAVIELIQKLKSLKPTVRDGILFESLEAYILNLNPFDPEKNMFIEDNLKEIAVTLAEVSPNPVSGYEGDIDKLHEYSKRIVKLIDDCGTIQKAIYLANISRAFAKHEIDIRVFFKLGQCIKMLTEEDLLFLRENISEGTINGDGDYIDDFRGVGLLYEVTAGFAYSKRAFLLLKYALVYEENVQIPKIFPARNVMTPLQDEEIDGLF